MRTLEEIKGRCVVTEDGHWLWKGALCPDGRANIYAPNYTKGPDCMSTQNGPRAVWHCKTGSPIPAGWSAYGVCSEMACCNPAHIRCTSDKELGDWIRHTRKLKGSVRRILANRAINRKRAVVTPELIAFITASPKTGPELAAELGISKQTVSKTRRGEFVSFGAAAGLFSGLIQNQGRGA